MEVLQKQLDALGEELGEVENEMARPGMDPSALVTQVVRFFGDVAWFLFLFFKARWLAVCYSVLC